MAEAILNVVRNNPDHSYIVYEFSSVLKPRLLSD